MTKLTIITKPNGRQLPFDEARLDAFIQSAARRYPELDTAPLTQKLIRTITARDEFPASEITAQLLLAASESTSIQEPDWTYVAAYIYLRKLYKEASVQRCYDSYAKYGNFYALLKQLTALGIYSGDLLRKYSKTEIMQLELIIDPERDNLLNYLGVLMLSERYLARGYDGAVFELPQERWLVIAMHLMSDEPADVRVAHVKEAYWALSNLYMTVATPTLANAGKSHGQLSSCFIDTVDDSLRGIYDSNTDIAELSKNGGGIAAYMGKVRAAKSSIRGYKGVSSGCIPWIRQLNNTAVSVDQLGSRSGAVAVYLDVWHADIMEFLDLRLNNGDDRKRARDIFTGVCLPDLFMEAVEKRGDWYLFDPHEVRTVMGFSLEDAYDERKGSGTFRHRYEKCVQSTELTSRKKVAAIDVMKRIMQSQLETGTPYQFFRDEVNRKNPNKHLGMVYSSNLCVEISQPMSATTVVSEELSGDEIIVRKKPGLFVTCNLSSINLPRAVGADVLERLVPIQMRMLDNVIDLNTITVQQARHTNERLRAVGIGTFGWHHLLAQKGIDWEKPEAVAYADELYEQIAYLAIKASADLAQEKGAYPEFEGSEWSTGKYFEDRGYLPPNDGNAHIWSAKWAELAQQVVQTGIRNGNLMAVAPNMSTAAIAGSTASIDPVFQPEYVEERKGHRIKVVSPGLTPQTFFYYKPAVQYDQHASIAQNAARQRHIDQSQSFNLYVPSAIKATKLLELYMDAWRQGTKTIYYIRSKNVDIETCEWCAG